MIFSGLTGWLLYSLIFMFEWLVPGNIGDLAFRYRIVQKVVQGDSQVLEIPSSSFVCLNGNIFEYDIATVERTQFDANGIEESRLLSYDTLGLYLLKPTVGKYFKISSKGSEIQFVDSGRIAQKQFGLSFSNSHLVEIEIPDPFSFRDTIIEGINLKIYEKVDIDSTGVDTIVTRYYYFTDTPVNSILTYIPAKRFMEKHLFRAEIYSKKDSYLYTVSIQDLAKLSDIEARQFRQLLPVLH